MVNDAHLVKNDLVYPANLTLAKGFSCSSLVAQSLMVASCRLAGADYKQFLSDECAVPPRMHEAVAVATDVNSIVFCSIE